MIWPFSLFKKKPQGFLVGATTRDDFDAVTLLSAFIDEPPTVERAKVICYQKDQFRALVYKYHDTTGLSYGFNGPRSPICRDYTLQAIAQVQKGAIDEGHPDTPAFGWLDYTKNAINPDTKKNRRHAIAFAIYADGTVDWYDTQVKRWLIAPDDVKSLDSLEIP